MEYILYVDINDVISSVNERVVRILKTDTMFGKVGGIKAKSNGMSCFCDVFTLQIDNLSDSIKYIAEESKQSLNVEFYMDLNSQCENVIGKTIYFVGKIMKEFTGNIVLMKNGDTAIVMRSDEKVIIDTSKVPAFYPFEMLKMEYIVNKLNF